MNKSSKVQTIINHVPLSPAKLPGLGPPSVCITLSSLAVDKTSPFVATIRTVYVVSGKMNNELNKLD